MERPAAFRSSALSTVAATLLALSPEASAGDSLCPHIVSARDLGELRGVTAAFDADCLRLEARPAAKVPRTDALASPAPRYAWAVIPPPPGGWSLERRASVDAEIANTGQAPAKLMLWVVGESGWDAVQDSAPLAPGESRRFSCKLRDAWPDGTPRIDPRQVKQIQVMLTGPITSPVTIEVRGLSAHGEAPEWHPPAARLVVPPVEDAAPAPGRRVRYRLAGDERTGIYSVLNLPEDWQPKRKFPVIIEYPGNVFFVPGCYSTGLPDQCVIGYGMTKGRSAICLGLPFTYRQSGEIAESGWGIPDETASYAMEMVEEVCAKFGGDRDNLVLTGFSRGALACGYIGLRHDRIASLWKGFHACQHYDGDGWNGATMAGALERAARFRGQAVFQTDNTPEKFQPVMDAMEARVTWAQSGLGAHATAMFLDDRPSTRQLREWFWTLVGKPAP